MGPDLRSMGGVAGANACLQAKAAACHRPAHASCIELTLPGLVCPRRTFRFLRGRSGVLCVCRRFAASTFIHSDASFSASDIATALVRPCRGARVYCSIKNGIDFNAGMLSTTSCKSAAVTFVGRMFPIKGYACRSSR